MMSIPPRGNLAAAQMFGLSVAPPGQSDLNMYERRPNSLAQPFRFRELLQKNEHVLIGACACMGSTEIMKIIAASNYDFIFLDAEHTPMGPEFMKEMIQTGNYYSEGHTATIVRIPTHGHEWIAWALDAGASGVVLPHTETAEQAREMVKAARFAPEGHRSFPPMAVVPGLTDGLPEGTNIMMEVWNKNAAVIPQIESALGAKNADAILSTPGVDAAMIGPGDLRMSLGLMPGMGGDEPEFVEAIESIKAAGKKHNKPIFIFALGPFMETRLKEGYKGLMVGADGFALASGLGSALGAAREAVKNHKIPN